MPVFSDRQKVEKRMGIIPETKSVARFVPSDSIFKLDLCFDVEKLRASLADCLEKVGYANNEWKAQGFGILPLNHRADDNDLSANDLSGRYWMRKDDRYIEEAFEDYVAESAYTEFDSRLIGTYLEEVYRALCARFPIGRVRILSKEVYNCNSWHRDPEPRLHIPIVSNPGALFVVNHHVTHLPADGSVYFTDTRGYHTAINGGIEPRVHLVAALAFPPSQN